MDEYAASKAGAALSSSKNITVRAPDMNSAEEPQAHSAGTSETRAVETEVKPAQKPTLWSALIDWFVGKAATRGGKSSDDLAQDRTDLAATRTLMAADRTLMAWQRTSLSMQTFGFTLYKILDAFQQAGGVLRRSDTPRNVGLVLTGMATVAMLIGTLEYWARLRELRQYRPIRTVRPSLVMAIIMSLSGLSLFFSIITHLF
jgi:putative membrane protein